MTSTPVKDVGSFFTNPGSAAVGKTAVGTGGFQKIWNHQMNRNAMGSYVPDSSAQGAAAQADASAETVKRTDADGTVQQREQAVQNDDGSTAESSGELNNPQEAVQTKDEPDTARNTLTEQTEELTPEELEQAMEVLGTAVLDLMQQIADAFGISMEDLQMTMDELGMGQMDLLNADAFGSLLLKLGGAEDSYALLMDETLYGNYQALMGQLDSTMEECAGALEMEPEQLEGLLHKISVSEVPAEVNLDSVQTANQEAEGQLADMDAEASVKAVAEVVEDNRNISDDETEGQSEQTGEDGRHNARNTEDKPRQEQIFAQNLHTEQFQPQVRQAESILQNSGWSADTRNIMNQVMDYMKLQLNVESTSLEMQLHPASLGTLRVQIDSSAGVLTAHFITQNESVKAALESQMVQLQESFEEQGVKVQAIEVTVQTHEFEQNLEQGRGRDQQTPEKKNRTRRIQLNDTLTMENMEAEDALAADMMAANGNTVDYTA